MANYPRTYLVTKGWQLYLLGSALVLGLPSLIGIWYFSSGHEFDTKNATYVGIGLCLIFVTLSIYLVLATLRSKIMLFADHIEIHELTITRTIARNEIAWWQLTSALRLKPKDSSLKTISTAWVYKADPELEQWFAEVDNLDEREVESSINEIADDNTIGANEKERFESLIRAKRSARVLNILGCMLFVWGAFFPQPYKLVVILLLAAPWLAALVVWHSSGLIQIDERPNDIKPSLAILTFLPMMALGLRAVIDYQTVGWMAQTAAALFIGVALFFTQRAAYADVRSTHLATAMTFLLVFLSYGYGAALHINALADSADTHQIRYFLQEKHISNGKVTSYKVTLDKIHPNAPDVNSVEVERYFYDRLKPGDSVCVTFRPGALGIKWFSAGPCSPHTP